MSRERLDQIGYAMLTVIRQDQDDLRREEGSVRRYDPEVFCRWVKEFVDDPGLLRKAPAYEVAALIRVAEEWLDHDELLLGQLKANIGDVLPELAVSTVLDDDAHAVEAVRQAQNSTVVWCRNSILRALDRAVVHAQENGTDLHVELAAELAKRGWLQDRQPPPHQERVLQRPVSSVGQSRSPLRPEQSSPHRTPAI